MSYRLFFRIALLAPLLACMSSPLLAHGPSFEERVAARRAIEEVYWRHRIWPRTNPDPKPPLSAVLPDAAIRAKVEDSLRVSASLETWWQRPLTPRALQAELDRMVRETRDPHMLRELFAALDDDPWLIAETLVRPALAERLARRWYAYDERFHGSVVAEARAASSAISGVVAMPALADRFSQRSYALRSEASPHRKAGPAGAATLELDPEEWSDWTTWLARQFDRDLDEIPLGRPSELQEDAESFFVVALTERSPGEATIVTLSWPKQPFDVWWEAERTRFTPASPAAGSSYTLTEPVDAPCEDDTWDKRFFGPSARSAHTTVWTGSEMILWGGYPHLATGARYDPATDTWLPTATVGAPIGRYQHTAVWTGSEMIVWGGDVDDDSDYNTATGAHYDPATDTWSPTAAEDAPIGRRSHAAVWTGGEMIVWGGFVDGGQTATGGRYDPQTGNWTPVSMAPGVPSQRGYAQAVWTGSEMIVWGGYDGAWMDSGGRYDPPTDSWLPTSAGPGVPSPRWHHTLVWTGSEMIVWGGGDAGGNWSNTGARYDPLTDAWTPTTTTGAPIARWLHAVVWTGTRMIVWGGYGSTPGQYLNSGGRYDPATDSWLPTAIGANLPSPRKSRHAVWTGSEMITWGGQGLQGAQLGDGGRYDPIADTWLAIVSDSGVPLGRQGHTAIWTGAEMIVWGGANGSYLNTGGRYDPATNAWAATPVGTAPSKRYHHTAVWTGTEMIVWGGFSQYPTLYLFTGSRYNPATNSWTATPTGGDTPDGREGHSAVWTGTEMIVWGGSCCLTTVYFDTGGRFAPATNTWTPTANGPGTPDLRAGHTAVWTDSEMIVWGGYRDPPETYWGSGGRYDPTSDSWSATATGGDAPEGRNSHEAVWTGSEMIVWGGWLDDGPGPGHPLDTGGSYDPASDEWHATATGGDAPTPRTAHVAAWVGDRMVVWGGWNSGYVTDGARYDPVGDSWSPVATTNAPQPRLGFTAVGQEAQMIVWGGSPYVTDVDIYCAAACAAALPSRTTGLVVERAGESVELSWNAAAGATAYDAVVGSLSELHASEGDFTASTTGCLADDVETTSVTDDAALDPGDGSFYLVRAVNCAGEGTIDSGATSQAGSRDDEIDASPVACP